MNKKLLIDNDCGEDSYCEQCDKETFHLRILTNGYAIVYVCERCYLKELKKI